MLRPSTANFLVAIITVSVSRALCFVTIRTTQVFNPEVCRATPCVARAMHGIAPTSPKTQFQTLFHNLCCPNRFGLRAASFALLNLLRKGDYRLEQTAKPSLVCDGRAPFLSVKIICSACSLGAAGCWLLKLGSERAPTPASLAYTSKLFDTVPSCQCLSLAASDPTGDPA